MTTDTNKTAEEIIKIAVMKARNYPDLTYRQIQEEILKLGASQLSVGEPSDEQLESIINRFKGSSSDDWPTDLKNDIRSLFRSQKQIKWKPEDGDTKCQKCHTNYPLWTAENELFNLVNGSPDGCVCPLCFEDIAKSRGITIRFVAENINSLSSQLIQGEETKPDEFIEYLMSVTSYVDGAAITSEERRRLINLYYSTWPPRFMLKDGKLQSVSSSVVKQEVTEEEIRNAIRLTLFVNSSNEIEGDDNLAKVLVSRFNKSLSSLKVKKPNKPLSEITE